MSCEFVQDTVESSYHRFFRAAKLVRRFSDALRLVEKLKNDTATEKLSLNRGTLGGTHLDNAVLSSAEEQDAMLYIRAAAAHTQGQKLNAALTGHVFYLCTFLILSELRDMQSTACEKHPLSFADFLMTRTPQTKTFSLLLKKRDFNVVSPFLYDQTDREETLLTRAKSPGQLAVCAAEKLFGLEIEAVTPSLAAEKFSPPSTLRDSGRLEKKASTPLSRFNLCWRPQPLRVGKNSSVSFMKSKVS